MFKRFSHLLAYILLLLMPLQSVAAANMLICNSVMQAEAAQMQNMPCHQSMNKQNTNKSEPQQSAYKTTCKTVCATLCAGLITIATLPSTLLATNVQLSTPKLNLPNQVYASITALNLQRPPIFLA